MTNNTEKAIHILLVEDNPGDMRLTTEALKEGKVRNELSWAKDGVEALDFLHKRGEFATAETPDLILLDLNLPKKNGREVLGDLKNHPTLKSIPVVVLTTSRAEEDILRSYELHANCYIIKPVDLDKFMAVVKAIDHFWLSIVTRPPTAEGFA